MNAIFKRPAAIFAFVALCLGPSACGTLPSPTTSEYLRTSVAAFEIDRQTRGVRYFVVYEVRKTPTEPLRVHVSFQNPVDASRPITMDTTLEPGQSELKVKSPTLPGIQNQHTYSVVITAYTGASETPVFTHAQKIVFIIPPGI